MEPETGGGHWRMEPETGDGRSFDPGREDRMRILDLDSKKVAWQDGYWSYQLTGLVLLRIGKPFWFWLPIALLGLVFAAIFFQAIAVALVAFLVLIAEEWYAFAAWPGWLEEYNDRIDAEIDRLRRQGHA